MPPSSDTIIRERPNLVYVGETTTQTKRSPNNNRNKNDTAFNSETRAHMGSRQERSNGPQRCFNIREQGLRTLLHKLLHTFHNGPLVRDGGAVLMRDVIALSHRLGASNSNRGRIKHHQHLSEMHSPCYRDPPSRRVAGDPVLSVLNTCACFLNSFTIRFFILQLRWRRHHPSARPTRRPPKPPPRPPPSSMNQTLYATMSKKLCV